MPADEVERLGRLIRARLAARGPGEPWLFLGFRYDAGAIRLAPLTARKLRALPPS